MDFDKFKDCAEGLKDKAEDFGLDQNRIKDVSEAVSDVVVNNSSLDEVKQKIAHDSSLDELRGHHEESEHDSDEDEEREDHEGHENRDFEDDSDEY